MSTGTRLPPPPAAKQNGGASAQAVVHAAAREWPIVGGKLSGPQRIVVYGPGGIGKSTLAGLAHNPVFLDIEGGTGAMDVPRVEGLASFADLRACLQSSACDAHSTVVVDSVTRAEEWALAHTIETVPHEKGHRVNSVEGYGFGKGLQHVYDTFMLLLQDCDSQIRRVRHVVLLAHDCISEVPNPAGENFIRYEPHLQAPRSGKASIRNRVVQWADHVLFLGYDVIAKDGKGLGSGTRTIWTFETPDHIAKSRVLATAMQFEGPDDGAIWPLILGGVS